MHGRGWIRLDCEENVDNTWRSDSRRSKFLLLSFLWFTSSMHFINRSSKITMLQNWHGSIIDDEKMQDERGATRWASEAERNVGWRARGDRATYRVADAARNDFYISNKWVSVHILGRQFGSVKRERGRERKSRNEAVTRLDALNIFTALFRYNTTRYTRLPVKKAKEREWETFV